MGVFIQSDEPSLSGESRVFCGSSTVFSESPAIAIRQSCVECEEGVTDELIRMDNIILVIISHHLGLTRLGDLLSRVTV